MEKPGQGEKVVPVQPFKLYGHPFGVDAGDASTEGAHHVSRQRDGEVEQLSGLGGKAHQQEPRHGEVSGLRHPRPVRGAHLYSEASRDARVRPLRDFRDV